MGTTRPRFRRLSRRRGGSGFTPSGESKSQSRWTDGRVSVEDVAVLLGRSKRTVHERAALRRSRFACRLALAGCCFSRPTPGASPGLVATASLGPTATALRRGLRLLRRWLLTLRPRGALTFFPGGRILGEGTGTQREEPTTRPLAPSVGSDRSDLAALYRRVAATLERSAWLAEQHAERQRAGGRSDATEVASAKRAHEAAERARDLASRML